LAETQCRGDEKHFAHNGVAPKEGGRRRVLIVGTRTLYLQALCELLDSTPGLSASLISPAELSELPPDPSPDVVLLDCEATGDGLEQLGATIGAIHEQARIVLLSWRTARHSSKQASELHVAGWVSMSRPVAELVRMIGDRGTGASDSRTSSSRRHRPPRFAPDVESPLSSLSERELSVLRLVVDGRSADEIAAMLGISRHTVRTHLQNIMAKLLVRSRIEMVSVARSSGMRPTPVEPPS
jgi:DNA-binding NarL/FixJ family response regulator